MGNGIKRSALRYNCAVLSRIWGGLGIQSAAIAKRGMALPARPAVGAVIATQPRIFHARWGTPGEGRARTRQNLPGDRGSTAPATAWA